MGSSERLSTSVRASRCRSARLSTASSAWWGAMCRSPSTSRDCARSTARSIGCWRTPPRRKRRSAGSRSSIWMRACVRRSTGWATRSASTRARPTTSRSGPWARFRKVFVRKSSVDASDSGCPAAPVAKLDPEMTDALVQERSVASAPPQVSLRKAAIMPAFNEADQIASVIAEIRAVDRDIGVIVIDDGSTDRTAAEARSAGAEVIRLPYNLGIGGAVQTGYKYAYEHGFQIAFQIDGDGQHDPSELDAIIAPVARDEADIVIGSRFLCLGHDPAPLLRRIGMAVFARFVSAVVRQPLSDTSSSFRAVNRRAMKLFAQEYPHGYLETVEATVMASKYGLRMMEVP